MKKTFVLLGLLSLVSIACSKGIKQVANRMQEYHFITIEEEVSSAHIGVSYVGDTAKYVGKILFNPETKQINYEFFDKETAENFKSLIYPFMFKNQSLFYLIYSKNKLIKTKQQDSIGYTNGLWYLYSSSKYGETDFWKAMNIAGLVESNADVNASQILRYRLVDAKVGAEYYNNKLRNEKRKGDLTKAIYLGLGDCIKYNGERYYCKN